MSDELSQDQIDSLLSQGFDDSSSDELPVSESVDEDGGGSDTSVLQSFFDLLNDQAATVVSTVLNNPFSMTLETCAEADAAAIREKLPTGIISLEVSFSEGLSGAMHVMLTKAETAKLSDLMMMGDGTAEYTEDHKDAICELLNQVMGAFVSAASARCDESFSVGEIKAVDYDWTSPPYSVDGTMMVLFSMTVGESTGHPLCFIVPEELAAQISKKCNALGPDTDDEDGGSGVGLNMDEISDLTSMTDDMADLGGGGGFHETAVTASSARSGSKENVDMLLDVELDICIELGRTNLSLKKILELAPDAIVELDRMAGEPVDLMVNNKVVAKGEVVVVDENFGVRIVSLVSPEERIKSLK